MKKLAILAIAFLSAALFSAEVPHIGYVFPAGGKLGTVLEVQLGGKFIKDATYVTVSGDGVTAVILPDPDADIVASPKPVAPISPVTPEQKPVAQVTAEQKPAVPVIAVTSEQKPAGVVVDVTKEQATMSPDAMQAAPVPAVTAEAKPVTVETKPAVPLAAVTTEAKPVPPTATATAEAKPALPSPAVTAEVKPAAKESKPQRQKPRRNDLFPDVLYLRLFVSDDAEPGEREMRVATSGGLSNKLTFMVGKLPEFTETEPNNRRDQFNEVKSLPAVINGTIMPGDVDVFKFTAKQGQSLVFRADTRKLKPFMADAVPGWFQGSMAIWDSKNNELMHSDGFYTGQEPVLLFDVPADGDYFLEIRDSIFRGREDFIYRITAGELPFISGIYPLGARSDTSAAVSLTGKNLPLNTIEVSGNGRDNPVQSLRVLTKEGISSNSVPFAFSDLPEITDAGTTGTVALTLPVIVNGRIGAPGDSCSYSFLAKEGETYALDVAARRLGSPLDSYLEVYNSSGEKLAENDDDATYKWFGTITHHADSFVSFKAPKDGTYTVRVRDTQGKGGPDFAFRLRVSLPIPDFDVCALPASVYVPKNGSGWLSFRAFRREGFKGDIIIGLSGEHRGIKLDNAVIPDGKNEIKASIECDTDVSESIRAVRFYAIALSGKESLTRMVIPCEEQMQAFAWKHLVSSQAVQLAVGRPLPFTLSFEGIPEKGSELTQGKETKVKINVSRASGFKEPITLSLVGAPDGIILRNLYIQGDKDSISTTLRAESKVRAGLTDNILLSGVAYIPVEDRENPDNKNRREKVSATAPVLSVVVLKGAVGPVKETTRERKPEKQKGDNLDGTKK